MNDEQRGENREQISPARDKFRYSKKTNGERIGGGKVFVSGECGLMIVEC